MSTAAFSGVKQKPFKMLSRGVWSLEGHGFSRAVSHSDPVTARLKSPAPSNLNANLPSLRWSSRRRALYFHAGPFFEQRQRCCVIEIAMPIFVGDVVDLFHRLQTRQPDSELLGRFQRQLQVFMHQAQREVRRKVTFQDKRRLIFDHARV